MNLNTILNEEKNIASLLSEDKLKDIGNTVVEGYESDLRSREGWETAVKSYLKLAMQICESKTFPWPDAANIKYPMISTAAMQFNARAYPTLVPSNGTIVSVSTVGEGSDQKQQRAWNVSKYMSYQILQDMYCWEEDMDKLLLMLPIFGVVHKKIYFDASTGKNCSELVHPFELVVDYWTKELRDSPRITHILVKSKNEIHEKTAAGLYIKQDLGKPTNNQLPTEKINVTHDIKPQGEVDDFTPYTILEQHTYLDLDDDGYFEPYIILVELESKKVLRITARFSSENVEADEQGNVIKISYPQCYFVKYSFIPSPDGSYYSRGFGHLLGPLNEAVNTILNQLVDAGTLSNLQSGFIGKGIKIRNGDVRFKPGEWKPVNNLGNEISANVFPLPVREPSNVLFQLLGMLVQSGKELASVAEIMTGKLPGQNTPAYTTQQTVEQGMKLFTAIYKRVYRSLSEEFKKLYDLNATYLDETEYQKVLDNQTATKQDFEQENRDIYPTADPSASSDYEKQQKLGQIGNLLQLGTISPMEYTQMVLDGFGVSASDIQKLTANSPANQPKQPNPEQQQIQAEMQMKQQESQNKIQTEQAKIVLKQKEAEMKMVMQQQQQLFDQKLQAQQFEFEQRISAMESLLDLKKVQDEHAMSMIQTQENHVATMEQKKEQARAATKKPQGAKKQ